MSKARSATGPTNRVETKFLALPNSYLRGRSDRIMVCSCQGQVATLSIHNPCCAFYPGALFSYVYSQIRPKGKSQGEGNAQNEGPVLLPRWWLKLKRYEG